MLRTFSILFVTITITLFAIVNVENADLVCDRPNEEYKCGSACQTVCSTLGEPCPIVNIRCNDACYCKENYARYTDDSGMCIPISECPPKN